MGTYGSLATCPRESLLGAACHTGVETRPGPPGHSQPMHTKRDMVCTGLPEAMLINSTTLTMTRMFPSRTALRGLWALVSAVQLVQRPAAPADLNRAHPVFLSQSGLKIGGAADTEIKTYPNRCARDLSIQEPGIGNSMIFSMHTSG